ncbi:MAG: J domain-containing protein, partial [Firmicutes bacterium]|nr:J domain-containing protein [Bacillota bacterium]
RGEITITLEDVLHGVEKTVDVVREEICPHCHGNQAEPGTPLEKCPTCHGTGHIEHIRDSFLGRIRQVETCSRCHGSGRIVPHPCQQCGGKGYVRAQRQLTVKVPPGVEDGMRLRVAGEGGAGARGGPAGDLMVFIHVKPHERFVRKGDDLWVTLPVGFSQAALGATVPLETLSATEPVHIPAGTQGGTVLKLPKLGLPHLGSAHSRGNLNVRIEIAVPTHLTAKEKELLKEWSDLHQEQTAGEEKSLLQKVKDVLGR